jgi:diguanylate cyclase (GGDEF)-like protein
MRRLSDVLSGETLRSFREQLIDLWDGKLFQQREAINYALSGEPVHVYLQFSVIPGREHDWSLVQIALTDITARKKAEAYLEFLGKHDVLTKLRNRSFFVDELNRLERNGPFPVSIIIADLNGLKALNDITGHAAGDALLRRVGEVLGKAAEKPFCAARIGGDEFAILLPGTDERAALAFSDSIETLIELNNKYYSEAPLSLSMGIATSLADERLEAVVRRADGRMYSAKHAFYAGRQDRRRQD